jgi:CRISPR-associated protein Cmr6
MPDSPLRLLRHRHSLAGAGAPAHAGLLLYRFLDGRKPPKTRKPEQEAYDAIWKSFAEHANRLLQAEPYPALLPAVSARQGAILAGLRARGWAAFDGEFRTSTRLAVGLSYGRVWSISFLLHPVLGVPYIPASGIKGALRCRMEDYRDDVDSILGRAPAGPEEMRAGAESASRVVLFDAFPQRPGEMLVEDVVNKHYEEYYEKDEPQPPADYWSPTPVKFLTVRRGIPFRFRFAVKPEPKGGFPDNTFARVTERFVDCLASQGLGAKTRGGYGRFRAIKKA